MVQHCQALGMRWVLSLHPFLRSFAVALGLWYGHFAGQFLLSCAQLNPWDEQYAIELGYKRLLQGKF